HWPRSVLDLLSLLQGRVMGTRAHPLSYAECLLFNWSFALCFLLHSHQREVWKWVIVTVTIGAALVGSQSRGPWIAAGLILIIAMGMCRSRRSWLLAGVGVAFAAVFALTPAMRARSASIMDQSHHSNKERIHMWKAGYLLWKSHPLLGIGPGNVKKVSE